MRFARTWRNAAVLIGVLPLRVPVLLALRCVAALGALAERASELVDDILPGLEPDYAWEEAKRLERRKARTAAMLPKCQATQRSDQMTCGFCQQAWDVNDPAPPKCGIKP